jgi:hypothetical protein
MKVEQRGGGQSFRPQTFQAEASSLQEIGGGASLCLLIPTLHLKEIVSVLRIRIQKSFHPGSYIKSGIQTFFHASYASIAKS